MLERRLGRYYFYYFIQVFFLKDLSLETPNDLERKKQHSQKMENIMRFKKFALLALFILTLVVTCGIVSPNGDDKVTTQIVFAEPVSFTESVEKPDIQLEVPGPYPDTEASEEEIAAYQANGPATYDMIVLFTNDAVAYLAGNGDSPYEWTNRYVKNTNEYLQNSGITSRARVTHIEVNIGPSHGMSDDLTKLKIENDGVWDYWATAGRAQYGADSVFIISKTDPNWCGQAWVAPKYDLNLFRPYAMGVVGPDCSSFTFAHELGHNWGAHHDPETSPDCAKNTLAPYTCGFRTTNWSTIMAYTSGTRYRIPYYSHPHLNWNGNSDRNRSQELERKSNRRLVTFWC